MRRARHEDSLGWFEQAVLPTRRRIWLRAYLWFVVPIVLLIGHDISNTAVRCRPAAITSPESGSLGTRSAMSAGDDEDPAEGRVQIYAWSASRSRYTDRDLWSPNPHS
jgi:hypothetical protein